MTCDNSTNIFLLGLASGMKTDIRTSDISQETIMTFAYAFSVTSLVAFGLTSNLISIDVFRQIQVRSTTVGFYLLIYSCCSIFGLLMLQCRLFQLIDTLTYIPFFIICNVVSGLASIFTRLCLWLNGFIALQRSFHSFENNRILNRIRSRSFAMKHILITMVVVFCMHIHELISRVTLPDPVAEDKFVCKIQYSKELLLLNEIFSLCHLFIPFLFHIISIGVIIVLISSRRARIHRTTYWKQWIKQFHTHSHLFLAPIVSMLCTLPQVILSLNYSCVDISLKWLLRLNTSANLIVYIPQCATFFLFIYQSNVYLDVLKRQSLIGKLICANCFKDIRVAPMTTTNTQPNERKMVNKQQNTIEGNTPL